MRIGLWTACFVGTTALAALPASAQLTTIENFQQVPSWTSTFDAGWGNAATITAPNSGGQDSGYLNSLRTGGGSSARVMTYNISPNTNYTFSIWMRCPNGQTGYWMETAFRLGVQSASDFDNNPGAWTLVKKFDGTSATNNNWVRYTATFASGGNSLISVGFKHGGSPCGCFNIGWDTLRIYPTSNSPPTYDSISISSPTLCADNSTSYTVSFTATDANGLSNLNMMLVLFNLDSMLSEPNSRGYLSWGLTRGDQFRYGHTNQGPASGGGFWGFHTTLWGEEYIVPVSCTTSISGNSRTVSWTFRVLPQWAISGPLSGNWVTMYAQDAPGDTAPWLPSNKAPYNLTFSVATVPNTGLAVAAQNSSICSGTGTNITVSGSEVGVSYQLRNAANANVGSAVNGTGGAINLPTGNLSGTTTFNVLATRNGCSSVQLSQTATVTVTTTPTTPGSPQASPGSICPGQSSTLSATPPANSTIEWYTGSCGGTPVPGGASPTVTPAATTTYYARSRSTVNNSCISSTCSQVTVTVNGGPDSDSDGLSDSCDGCPNDTTKTAPGVCGCNSPDVDNDADAYLACQDCDDNNADVHPGANEICDGIDNNCDTNIDEGFDIGQACDGIGACGAGTIECSGPTGTRCSTDPGGSQDQSTAEVCGDGNDNDCDGMTDEGFTDSDGDGVADCVDNCPAVPNPGQEDFDGDNTGDACEVGPTITAWASVRSHGNAFGDLGLALDPAKTNSHAGMSGPKTEPRFRGLQKLEITFSEAVEAVDGTLDANDVVITGSDANSYSADGVSLTDGGTKLVVTFTPDSNGNSPLPDGLRYTIDLAGRFRSSASHGMLGGDTDCQVRALVGDVNGDGSCSLIDVQAVKAKNREAMSSANARFDVNLDGKLNLIDFVLVKNHVGNSAP